MTEVVDKTTSSDDELHDLQLGITIAAAIVVKSTVAIFISLKSTGELIMFYENV